MSINVELEHKVQQVYVEECAKHLTIVSNILFNENLSQDSTLVGLADGFASILAKQADLDVVTKEDTKLCNDVLELVEQRGDKLKSLVLITKLCTEMLSKSMIAKEVANDIESRSEKAVSGILEEIQNQNN